MEASRLKKAFKLIQRVKKGCRNVAAALTSMQDAAIRMFHRRHVQFLQRELNDAESSVDAKEQNALPSKEPAFF